MSKRRDQDPKTINKAMHIFADAGKRGPGRNPRPGPTVTPAHRHHWHHSTPEEVFQDAVESQLPPAQTYHWDLVLHVLYRLSRRHRVPDSGLDPFTIAPLQKSRGRKGVKRRTGEK